MRTNVPMIVRRTLMPPSSAASGLPPIAYTYRPNRRRVARYVIAIATPSDQDRVRDAHRDGGGLAGSGVVCCR